MKTLITFLLLASTSLAAEIKVHRDLPYAQSKNERQTLDVYAPAEGKGLPVVFWIHGGGWQAGSKADVQKKPQAFVDKGFVIRSRSSAAMYSSIPSRASSSLRAVRK
ncbi:MAG: hypothetical protein CMJ64_24025 [Planctomycetaceae bacterium]|nr:hypothetical protein [Planctomycetaceae bacterium]